MNTALLEGIGPAMQSYVDDGGFAGISVVVARHGRIVFEGQHGQRDREAGLAMAPDAIFRISSMTKPVVAAGLMSLVDDGDLVDVDRPLVVSDLLTHTAMSIDDLIGVAIESLDRHFPP